VNTNLCVPEALWASWDYWLDKELASLARFIMPIFRPALLEAILERRSPGRHNKSAKRSLQGKHPRGSDRRGDIGITGYPLEVEYVIGIKVWEPAKRGKSGLAGVLFTDDSGNLCCLDI